MRPGYSDGSWQDLLDSMQDESEAQLWAHSPLFLPPSQQSALPAFLSTFTKHLCVSYHQNVILELQTDLKVNRNITF